MSHNYASVLMIIYWKHLKLNYTTGAFGLFKRSHCSSSLHYREKSLVEIMGDSFHDKLYNSQNSINSLLPSINSRAKLNKWWNDTTHSSKIYNNDVHKSRPFENTVVSICNPRKRSTIPEIKWSMSVSMKVSYLEFEQENLCTCFICLSTLHKVKNIKSNVLYTDGKKF